MKIPTAIEVRAWDEYTMTSQSIDHVALMDRAAEALTRKALELYAQQHWLIWAGVGNNGGDGLAMARLLLKAGKIVKVILVGDPQKATPSWKVQYARLQRSGVDYRTFSEADDWLKMPQGAVVDALLGRGTNRLAVGEWLKAIHQLNQLKKHLVLSVDIPSGIIPDVAESVELAVAADHTLAIECPSLGVLIAEHRHWVGSLHVVPIALSPDFEFDGVGQFEWYDLREAQMDFRPRKSDSNKFSHGHLQVLAGSVGKAGAAILACQSALYSGAGLVTAHLPSDLCPIMQQAVPVAMCTMDSHAQWLATSGDSKQWNARLVGPGIGREAETGEMVKSLLSSCSDSMVIDADALYWIATLNLLEHLPKGCILTPHEGEFKRLFGSFSSDLELWDATRYIASRFGVIVVLKGPQTRVFDCFGQLSFNGSGNAGLAKAGSGDVLSGVIAGLLVQGYEPAKAARLGVWIHGKAAEFASQEWGLTSITAKEVMNCIPLVFKWLESHPQELAGI